MTDMNMTQMTTADLLKRSVTADDIGNVTNGVINMIIPLWPSNYNNVQALPPTPPAYWTPTRDDVLRSTVHHEAMWAAAISIAITKMASKSWEIKSDIPRRAKTGRELLLYADGRTEGHTQFIYKHLRDFLTTDNGSFIEIVRRSSSLSSQIIGLRHLDSRRCQRTGDPNIPVLYRDRHGQYHELKDYQVMYFSDMPEPSETFYGVGQCAASRSYAAIYKLAAIERYISEKISGLRPLAIYIVNGMVQRQIEGAISSAQSSVVAQGVAAYMGAVIVGIPADKPPQVATIPLAELPDRFERKEEFDIALLTYADNIGLDIQDLQPLSGQALGTGAQSEVLHDKASGKGLVAWQQEFTHKYNEQVLPDLTEFLFIEHDYRDMKAKADITKARADAYGVMSDKGFILPEQGTSILVDQDELPKEFLEQITAARPQETTISDTEKPEKEGDIPEKPAQQQPQPPQPPPQPPQPGQPPAQPPPAAPQPPPAPATKEYDPSAPQTGAMLALYPPPSVATQLASYSDAWPADAQVLPPSESHLTLVYLGDITTLPYQRAHLQKVLANWLAHCDAAVPITGRINGVGRFDETSEQGQSAIYANFDAADLPALRQSLVEHLHHAAIETPSTHGFTPHITLAYVPQSTPIPPGNWSVIEPVTIPSLSLCWGSEHVEFALTAKPVHKELTAPTPPTPEQVDALPASPSQDALTKVLASQDEARHLYERLRKKKELSERMAASIDAISFKHLVGEHNQHFHGNRGTITSDAAAGESSSYVANDKFTEEALNRARTSPEMHKLVLQRPIPSTQFSNELIFYTNATLSKTKHVGPYPARVPKKGKIAMVRSYAGSGGDWATATLDQLTPAALNVYYSKGYKAISMDVEPVTP